MRTKILNSLLAFAFLAVTGIFYTACKKDKTDDPVVTPPETVDTNDQEASDDNNLAEEESESIDDLIEQESSNTEMGGRFAGPVCKPIDTLFVNPANYSCVDSIRFVTVCGSLVADYRLVTFYFNPANPCGKGRRYRKGAIEFKLVGPKTMKMSGCSLVVTLKDYSIKIKDQIDWIKVEGQKTFTVDAVSQSPISRTMTVKAVGGKMYIVGKSDTIKWESTRTKTVTWENLVRKVVVNGTASGTSKKGIKFTTTLDTLKRQSDCYWSFLSGKITFKRDDKPNARILDFSSDSAGVSTGVCDEYVKISVGTNSKVVKMK